MSLEAIFTPVTVGKCDSEAGTDSIKVSCYRSVLGGKHFVHLDASDGSSLYLTPEDAARLARVLEKAALAAHAARTAEVVAGE